MRCMQLCGSFENEFVYDKNCSKPRSGLKCWATWAHAADIVRGLNTNPSQNPVNPTASLL